MTKGDFAITIDMFFSRVDTHIFYEQFLDGHKPKKNAFRHTYIHKQK
jgi:hypothetical protein